MSIEGLNPLFIIQKYKDKYSFIENEPVSGENYKLQPSWYTKTKDKINELVDDISFWDKIDIKKSSFDIPDGLPIPFVLCSQMDLIIVDQKMVKSNSVEYNDDLKIQSQLRNSLVIQLRAKAKSIFTSAIIGLLQWCWENAKLYEYDISYFNDNFLVKQGHLGDFQCQKSNKDGWYDIQITLDQGLTPKDKLKNQKEKEIGSSDYFNSKNSTYVNR